MANFSEPTQDAIIDPGATTHLADVYAQNGPQAPALPPPQFLQNAIGTLTSYGNADRADMAQPYQPPAMGFVPNLGLPRLPFGGGQAPSPIASNEDQPVEGYSPTEQAAAYNTPVFGGIARVLNSPLARAVQGTFVGDQTDNPAFALGPVGELTGPTEGATAALGNIAGRLKTGLGEAFAGRAPNFVTEPAGMARVDFGVTGGFPEGEPIAGGLTNRIGGKSQGVGAGADLSAEQMAANDALAQEAAKAAPAESPRFVAQPAPGRKTMWQVVDSTTGKPTLEGKAIKQGNSTPEAAAARAAKLNAKYAPAPDKGAQAIDSAVKAVPETVNSNIRKMLRGEIPNVNPAALTPDALAAHPQFQSVIDKALTDSGAEVSDASRLAVAQKVLDAQVIRNKIIVAKGYRNVPELPADAPILQEATTLPPDQQAAVMDRTRQVLDAAQGKTDIGASFDAMVGDAGKPPTPPEGPKLIATGGPNEPRIPTVPERKFGMRDLGQLASEVMYDSIVFPTTNLVHSFGSTASAIAQFPEHVLLSGVDRALSEAGITKARNFTTEAAIAGLNAQLHSLGPSIAHDLIPTVLHGNASLIDRDVPREVSTAILRGEYGSGKLATVLGALAKVSAEGNYPLRTIAAIDDTIRRGLSASNLMERGYVEGTNAGLTGQALHDYAANFVNTAGPFELKAAEDAAKAQINRSAPGGFATRILDIKDKTGIVGTVLLPFFNTKLNILKAATTWSPLGFARLLPSKTPVLGYFARGTATEAARVQALTRATVGTMLLYPIWQQVLSDNITGDGPTDPREKAQWVGDPANPSHVERALRTPFGWVTYGKVPVIGDYVAAIADAAQAVRENRANDVSGAQAAVSGLIQYFGKEEQGISDAITTIAALSEAWQNPNNAQAQATLAQELANRGFQMTPYSGAIRAEQTIAGEPYKRIPPGTKGLVNRTLEDYRSQIPGLNADMPNGTPRVPGVSSGVGALLPVRTAPEAPPMQGTATGVPPVANAESERLAAAVKDFKPIGLPTNKVGVGKPYEMTLSGSQYLDFSQAVGEARQAAVNKLMTNPDYQNAPVGIQARMFTIAIAAADKTGQQDYLRNGVLTSNDPAQIQQDALLLMSQGTMSDRAKWAGLMAQSGKLTPAIRSAIDAARPEPLPGQAQMPTMDQYIHAAPLVSQYLAIPPYLQGNEQEWAALKVAKARLSAAENSVRATGTYLPPTALHYQALSTLSPADQQLILKYPPVLTNPLRAAFLKAHPEVGRFVQ